jgi:hypothetical protein
MTMTHPFEDGTLGTKLLGTLMHYVRNELKPWGQLTSDEQTEVLEMMQERIDDALKAGVVSILSAGLDRVQGNLKSITAKDGVRAIIDVTPESAQSLHDLVDRVGSTVVIVLAGPAEHAVEIEKFNAEPDQPDLPGLKCDGNHGAPICADSECWLREEYEPCDRKHDSPVCEDPNCWQSPDTTVGADDDEEDDDD